MTELVVTETPTVLEITQAVTVVEVIEPQFTLVIEGEDITLENTSPVNTLEVVQGQAQSIDIIQKVFEVLEVGTPGPPGPPGDPGSAAPSFETVSKNLEGYPFTLNYTDGVLTTIVYDLGGGDTITKTFGYTSGILTSIILSGDTPSGIDLTKTLSYTGSDLTGVTYS